MDAPTIPFSPSLFADVKQFTNPKINGLNPDAETWRETSEKLAGIIKVIATSGYAWIGGRKIEGPLPQSPWLHHTLRFTGSINPTAIATAKTDKMGEPGIIDRMAEVFSEAGIEIYDSTVKNNHTQLFLCRSQHMLEVSGFFNKEIHTDLKHKGSKRMLHMGKHEMAILTEESIHPTYDEAGNLVKAYVPISEYDGYFVRVIYSNKLGDGQGSITYNAALRSCTAGGMSEEEAIKKLNRSVAVQIFGIGKFPFKGLLWIQGSEKDKDKRSEYDILLDAANIKTELSIAPTAMKLKLVETPAKRGTPVVVKSWIAMGMPLIYAFGSQQVKDVSIAVVKSHQRAVLRKIMGDAKDEDSAERPQQYSSEEENPYSLSFIQELLEGIESHSPSIWNNPENVKRVAGGLGRRIRSKWEKRGEFPVLLSGRNVILIYAPYAGHKFPRPGHGRIIFSEGKTVGIAFNPKDSKQIQQLTDGSDFDLDMVSLHLAIDLDGHWAVYGQRSPRSPGGGFMLRITKREAEAMLKEGFIPYRQQGEDPYAYLHEVDEKGELVSGGYPLAPQPLDEEFHPKICDDPIENLYQGIIGAEERGIMGASHDLIHTMEHSGIFEPKLACLLSDLIDSCGTETRVPMYNEITDHVIDSAMNGAILDECFQERVIRSLARRLEETGRCKSIKEAFNTARYRFKWGHKPACWIFREAAEEILDLEDKELNRLYNMANGPTDLIAAELDHFPEGLIEIAQKAFRERNAVWNSRAKPAENLYREEKKAAEANAYQTARRQEADVMRQAESAAAELGYDAGQLAAAYQRAAVTYRKRFPYGDYPTTYFKASPLGHLEDQEAAQQALSGYQPAVPTLLLRVSQRAAASLTVGQTLTIGKESSGENARMYLEDPETHANVLTLAESVKPWHGLTVRVVKFLLPTGSKTRRDEEDFHLLLVEVVDLLPKRTRVRVQETLTPAEELADRPRARIVRDEDRQYYLEYRRQTEFIVGEKAHKVFTPWQKAAALKGILEFHREAGDREYVLHRIDGKTAIIERTKAKS